MPQPGTYAHLLPKSFSSLCFLYLSIFSLSISLYSLSLSISLFSLSISLFSLSISLFSLSILYFSTPSYCVLYFHFRFTGDESYRSISLKDCLTWALSDPNWLDVVSVSLSCCTFPSSKESSHQGRLSGSRLLHPMQSLPYY